MLGMAQLRLMEAVSIFLWTQVATARFVNALLGSNNELEEKALARDNFASPKSKY